MNEIFQKVNIDNNKRREEPCFVSHLSSKIQRYLTLGFFAFQTHIICVFEMQKIHRRIKRSLTENST